MDGMDYVVHSPEPSSSSHQAPGPSCPFVSRPDPVPNSGQSRPTPFYDPVHHPGSPWLSPPLYQWQHPPPISVPPQELSQSGLPMPSPNGFYPTSAVTQATPTHHSPAPLFGHSYPVLYPGTTEAAGYRSTPSSHRMSAPSGLSGPSSSQPGSPPQLPQSSQHNWNSRPLGGMSPPASSRHSSSHRRHDGTWASGEGSSQLPPYSGNYHAPHGADVPHIPGVYHAAPYTASSSRPEPPSPRRSIGFGGFLRPGQATEGPTTQGETSSASSSSRPQQPIPPPAPLSFSIASSSERRRPPPTRHRRPFSRMYSERDREMEDDVETVLMEQIMNSRPGAMDETHLRAAQFFRGSVSTKMVASPSALRSLESVALEDVPEGERMCVICYNDFGQETPEGVKEAPLRLPKCKHIFGDHCIKKWFEDSDSCPYCRDKLPSEPRIQATSRAFLNFLRMRNPTGNAQQDSETFIRAMTRGEVERTSGSGRRTPPSDNGEYRRRIRARHGSRGSGSPPSLGSRPNSFTGPSSSTTPAPAQPRHERPNLPGYSSIIDGQRSITHGPTQHGNGPRMVVPAPFQSVRFADPEVTPAPQMPAEPYGTYAAPAMRMGPVYANPLSSNNVPAPIAVPVGPSPHVYTAQSYQMPPRETLLPPGEPGRAGY